MFLHWRYAIPLAMVPYIYPLLYNLFEKKLTIREHREGRVFNIQKFQNGSH